MTEYVQITCVECSRSLRVRLEYIGHEIACNHCNHSFLATSREPRVLHYLLQRAETNPSAASSANQELAEIRRQVDAICSAELAVRGELGQARRELERSAKEAAVLQRDRERLAAENAELDQLRAEAQARSELLQCQLDRARHQADQCHQQHEQQCLSLRKQLDDQQSAARTAIDELGKRNSALTVESTSRSETLKAVQAERDKLAESIDNLKASRLDADRAFSEQRQELTCQIDALVSDHLHLKEALTSAEGALSDAQRDWDQERQAWNGVRQSLSVQLASMAKERDELNRSLTALESERASEQSSWQAERASLTHRIEAIEADRARLAAMLGELEKKQQDELRDWQDERSRLSEHVLALTANRDSLAASLSTLEQNYRQAEQTVDQLAVQCELAKQEAAGRQTEIAGLSELFEQDRAALSGEIEQLRQQLAEESARWRCELEEIARELDALRIERDSFARAVDLAEQERKQLELDADEVLLARKTQRRSVVKIARLTRSLECAWKHIELLRQRNSELAARSDREIQAQQPSQPQYV